MPRKPTTRQCMRCGHTSPGTMTDCEICHAPLVKKRFAMNPARIAKVHAIALTKKGLSYDEYKDVLAGMGLKSCKAMKQKQYNEFLRRMKKLPDARRAA